MKVYKKETIVCFFNFCKYNLFICASKSIHPGVRYLTRPGIFFTYSFVCFLYED